MWNKNGFKIFYSESRKELLSTLKLFCNINYRSLWIFIVYFMFANELHRLKSSICTTYVIKNIFVFQFFFNIVNQVLFLYMGINDLKLRELFYYFI